MADICVNVEPILECGKKPDNTKKSLDEKIKLEKLKHKQMRERHRLKEQLKDERNALLPKLPRSFERLLHLLIKQALLKRPPKISTFFSQLLDKLLDCRIKQELGLSSSRLDLRRDDDEQEPGDEEEEDYKTKFIDFEEEGALSPTGLKLPLTPERQSVKSTQKSIVTNKSSYAKLKTPSFKSDASTVKPGKEGVFAIKPGDGRSVAEMGKGGSVMKTEGNGQIMATKLADGKITASISDGRTSINKSRNVRVSSTKSGSDKITTNAKAMSKIQLSAKPRAESKLKEGTNGDKQDLDEIEKCLQSQEIKEIEEIAKGKDINQVNISKEQLQ